MSEQSTPVTLTPGVGTTQIQLSSALVENCQQRKCNFMENLNSSSNVDIYPSSPPQRPLPPRRAFRRAAADRPRPVAVGRSPAVAPPATDAAADATASEAARSLARPREEAEENSTRGEETSKVPFGAHHFTAGRRLLGTM